MGNIGIPDILIALLVIGLPVWASQKFPLPKTPVERAAVVVLVVLLGFQALQVLTVLLPPPVVHK
jgi:hypothetical protein